MRQHKVFVYGTLLQGEANHGYLRRARFLGTARTPPGYRLFSLGSYPVICPGGRQTVSGEVYQVSDRELALLDALEEYPEYYLRRQVATPYGQAWVYYQNRPPLLARPLDAGDWRRNRGRRLRRSGQASLD